MFPALLLFWNLKKVVDIVVDLRSFEFFGNRHRTCKTICQTFKTTEHMLYSMPPAISVS